MSKKIINNHVTLTTGAKNLLNITKVKSYESGGVHSNGSNESIIGTGISFFAKISFIL